MKKLSLILSCIICIPAVPVLAGEITCPAIVKSADVTCDGPDEEGYYTPKIKIGSESWKNYLFTNKFDNQQDCVAAFSKQITSNTANFSSAYITESDACCEYDLGGPNSFCIDKSKVSPDGWQGDDCQSTNPEDCKFIETQ